MKPTVRAKLLLLFLLLGVLFMHQSCHSTSSSDQCSGKQVTCPSFDNPIAMLWLPYSVNQQLIYTSTNAKSDTFTMRIIDLSKSFSSTVSGNSPDCSASGVWRTNPNSIAISDTNIVFSVNQSIDQYTSSQKVYSDILVKSFYVDANGYADTGLIKTSSSSNFNSLFQASLTLNGKTFTNVQAIQIDTTNSKLSSGKVYKIYIAKNVGLVAYQNYPDNKLWVKQ